MKPDYLQKLNFTYTAKLVTTPSQTYCSMTVLTGRLRNSLEARMNLLKQRYQKIFRSDDLEPPKIDLAIWASTENTHQPAHRRGKLKYSLEKIYSLEGLNEPREYIEQSTFYSPNKVSRQYIKTTDIHTLE